MGTINPSIPTIGDLNATEDADIRSALITIRDAINGGLDNDNTASAANIVYSKLNLTNSVVNGDLANNSVLANSIGILPSARAYKTTNTSIPASVDTVLPLDTENFDTDSMHSVSVNTGRMTIVTAGIYLFTGTALIQNNASGQRLLHLFHNATTKVGSTSRIADGTTENQLSASGIYSCVATDYIDMRVWQNSGGSLNCTNCALAACWLSDN